ncbi:MAG: S-layer homology domain-containing protein [Clostridia bacterium]|nr:S-layer homology domain-containing protein [Clostridia bacterium]
MTNKKRFLAVILSIALALSCCSTVFAANETNSNGVVFTAALDKAQITKNGAEQTVVMTVTTNKAVAIDSAEFDVDCDDELTPAAPTSADMPAPNFLWSWNAGTKHMGGMWAEFGTNAEGVTEICQVVFTVPADIEVGEYTVGISGIMLSADAEYWEEGASASATLTVLCPHNDTELINVVAPSCKDDGYTGDLYCNDCEKIIEEGETDPATGEHVDVDNGEWKYDDAEHYYVCGCGEKFDNADHVYNKSVAEEQYLASEATCTAKATYYMSCICGKAGTETFETGKTLAHVYDQEKAEDAYLKTPATCTKQAVYYKSCSCGKAGTATFSAGETAPHVYDKTVATSKYLKTPATCTAKAVYYKSCVCGLASETETFESGNLAKHVYDQEKAEDAYLKTPATCTTKAVYYKSCICGATGTTTFSAGETAPHVYDKTVATAKYLKTAGTCMDEAVYYKSCVCGLASETETFETEKNPANHVSDGSDMEHNETQHWGTCVCLTPIEPENHKGGKATCKLQAVCSVCGASYGELNPAVHGETELRGAVEATCTEDGYTGDTCCVDCDTVVKAGKVIPAAHKWDKGVITLEPTDEADGEKTYTCTGCGETKVEPVSKKHDMTITPSNPEFLLRFSDVEKSDWFYNDVVFAYENGLMNGTADDKFSPEMTTDRAMIVTVLWRLEGSPVVDSTVAFSDVAADMWYTAAIDWAAANGIVNGYGDGNFGPADQITREQIMAILNRYAQYKGWAEDIAVTMVAQYTCSIWAENNVNWADMNGLLAGLGVDVTDMTASASRAELAAYLCRFMTNFAK